MSHLSTDPIHPSLWSVLVSLPDPFINTPSPAPRSVPNLWAWTRTHILYTSSVPGNFGLHSTYTMSKLSAQTSLHILSSAPNFSAHTRHGTNIRSPQAQISSQKYEQYESSSHYVSPNPTSPKEMFPYENYLDGPQGTEFQRTITNFKEFQEYK